jgi:hypothetical protein
VVQIRETTESWTVPKFEFEATSAIWKAKYSATSVFCDYSFLVKMQCVQLWVFNLIKSVLKINPVHFVYSEPLLLIVLISIILIRNYVPFVRIFINTLYKYFIMYVSYCAP